MSDSPFKVDTNGVITMKDSGEKGKAIGCLNPTTVWGENGAKLFEGAALEFGSWVDRFSDFLKKISESSGFKFAIEKGNQGKKVRLKWEEVGVKNSAASTPGGEKSRVRVKANPVSEKG